MRAGQSRWVQDQRRAGRYVHRRAHLKKVNVSAVNVFFSFGRGERFGPSRIGFPPGE
jgi:hypothetical protein